MQNRKIAAQIDSVNGPLEYFEFIVQVRLLYSLKMLAPLTGSVSYRGGLPG